MNDTPVITSEIFVAYSLCPRKAFLLLFSQEKGRHHDYSLIQEEVRENNRIQYLEHFLQLHPKARAYDIKNINKHELLVDAKLKSDCLEAYCAVLAKDESCSTIRRICYEPIIVISTYNITTDQKTELLFVGWVLGQIQKHTPVSGKIVGIDGKVHQVQMENSYKNIKLPLKILQNWCNIPPSTPPSLVLNKHCPSCQFRQICREQAEKENNLSLLDRITTKAIHKYNKRGIFTVQQLSYLFKPRRKRKTSKDSELIKHSLELQALAIREQKTYIQEISKPSPQPIELFLDIEGIPDQRFYYLIGLLVCDEEHSTQYSFWADSREDEGVIWEQLLSKLNEYPQAPIFHYGSYEIKAFFELTKRYSSNTVEIKKNLVNVNSMIFGKIYFPIYSNSLKEIGAFIGASWTSKQASGLQSLAWRYKWEKLKDDELLKILIDYNQEDCKVLKILVDRIKKISESIKLDNKIEIADHPKKMTTEAGKTIHFQLESILKSSHLNYNKNKITLYNQENRNTEEKPNKHGAQYNHPTYHHRFSSRPDKLIDVPMKSKCPICQSALDETKKLKNKIIIDLKIIKNGLQKKIIKYFWLKGYCKQCRKFSEPDLINELGNQLFSHSFQAWIVNQRLVLRLPINIIQQNIQEILNETISQGTIVSCIKRFSKIYSDSEKILLKKILDSLYIHADETPININGRNQYVWTFTNGNHVIFKLTDSRESSIVHETLQGYNGILISDFYGGYDAIPCKQQKCLVHLLREINDDLWKNPFDKEYENFIANIQKLILPVFDAINKYGLKKRHLAKFKKEVDKFYQNNIDDKIYHSELTIKYQKRFDRYRDGLFTFLDYDLIPWHNNTAERALRHITIQEKISGSFFESGLTSYLTMLGIVQTCRFQEKSFLKFLLSGEKNIDDFKPPKTRKKPN